MVMEASGVKATEREVCIKSNCDEEGTDEESLAAAAIAFGFKKSSFKYLIEKDDIAYQKLNDFLAQGIFPIVHLKGLYTSFVKHAVIVLEAGEREVWLLDPMPQNGERKIAKGLFLPAWSETQRTVILVER